MVEITGLHKNYGRLEVLKGCDLVVARGEVVVICGPSGSGKSTLIKCVNGLEKFDGGSVVVDGIAVGKSNSEMTRLRQRVGMVFQHFELYPHLTVLQNVCLAQIHVLKRDKRKALTKARDLLARVGLPDKESFYPAQLSGGQQQRVAIARALAVDPIAMLFDEPTSALDPEMIGEVLSVMLELAREGMTMMVVTHEMGFARKAADRIVFMDHGSIIETAPTKQFFEAPRAERARLFLSRILSH
ncbi:amino acid ABC transporter ATP-binding protein [Bradyrhizobium sp. SZCCHNS2005]|uniref:amino acid ABC transporter ATP-binding protein n=1 Tax=Bradyrhizobium sp. SZCCHNS2005 TaxID=3057303 RepID=UPI0028EB353A|nr:amino acid ABC transporter ATP-binding protein [Bradyrhizobium sp. SZCCHNS2005]